MIDWLRNCAIDWKACARRYRWRVWCFKHPTMPSSYFLLVLSCITSTWWVTAAAVAWAPEQDQLGLESRLEQVSERDVTYDPAKIDQLYRGPIMPLGVLTGLALHHRSRGGRLQTTTDDGFTSCHGWPLFVVWSCRGLGCPTFDSFIHLECLFRGPTCFVYSGGWSHEIHTSLLQRKIFPSCILKRPMFLMVNIIMMNGGIMAVQSWLFLRSGVFCLELFR